MKTVGRGVVIGLAVVAAPFASLFGGLAVALAVAAFVLAVVGVVLYGYFRSVGSSIAAIARGGGEEGMAAMERALAVAEIGALALLADGEVTAREEQALDEALRAAHFDVNVREALARGRAAAPDATDPAGLRDAIARAARRLGPEPREQAFDLVLRLSRAGASLATEADGYRVSVRKDPAALVALFADALQIMTPSARAPRR